MDDADEDTASDPEMMADEAHDDITPDAMEAVDEPEPDAEPETEGEEEAEAEAEVSNLDLLPGIGPGLIWMLQTAGVSSLADMAAADATELGGKLGLVGDLLDLEHWIAEASKLEVAGD